ncbi:DNA mismatch repair protein MutT [Clostridium butyricum]|uniref:NUDIX domain-containing protein n=2 Tax=Clostridiaceae TaxID=31979 RepID=A0AAP9UGT3_CLOBU|nr:NUDIX domain-containing protein [Clostridium butyricum]POO85036.1 NUDIX domain-containing protein [Clostridium sp. 3-3]MBC2427155.1 NUDIX domain-containing protein [Clostridium butyricum]MZI80295.1 NUDIX domain-containing protein [Clostridium butyricum]NFB73475.1 NUDIX domain-containing protein [Clostridium butyricum]
MEIWDGYFRDGTRANIDLVRGDILPDGLYHMVCEVLVQHKDGDYLLMRRDISKSNYGGYYEATAGGSALKGEDKMACVKRELLEETGVVSENFKELGRFIYDDYKCIFYTFLCTTDCDKTSIALQNGETMSYKWVNETDFISFVNSKEIIEIQKNRYLNYFNQKGYLHR